MKENAAQDRCSDRLDGGELGGPGGLHALHAGGIEDIGEASGEKPAQKCESRSYRAFEYLTDTPFNAGENKEAQHSDAETLLKMLYSA